MKPLRTITWRRALLIAALPSVGSWRTIREEEPFPDDAPFARRPRIFEFVIPAMAGSILLAGALAESGVLVALGGFATAFSVFRPLGRLIAPRSLAHTERELLAITTPTGAIHLVWYGFLFYLMISGQWFVAGILLAILACYLVIGSWLIRLMMTGLVGRMGKIAPR